MKSEIATPSTNGKSTMKNRLTGTAEPRNKEDKHITISPPKWAEAKFRIVGNAPLMIAKFSTKSKNQIHEKHVAGSHAAGKKPKRESKDFKALYEAAKYVSREGWCGINALSFKNALIGACRTVDFKMVMAKLTLRVLADGYDRDDGTPLVKIVKGQPQYDERPARNASGGADLRARPRWDEWECVVRIKYDTEFFSLQDVASLLMRAGYGGVGEGRPSSKNSSGMDFGTFDIAGAKK